MNPDLQARKALAAHIRDACINVGFFYGPSFPLAALCPVSSSPVSNHGLPESVIGQALGAAKRFFALPLSAKEEVVKSKSSPHPSALSSRPCSSIFTGPPILRVTRVC